MPKPSIPLSEASKPVDFDKIAAEIKIEKKKRGRPPGSKTAPSVATPPSAPHGAPSAAFQSAPIATPTSIASEPFLPNEVLVPIVQFPFAVAVNRTHFEGFALSKAEAEMIAPQVDRCLKQYLPALQAGPHSALFALGATVVTVTALKIIAYTAWRKDLEKDAMKAAAERASKSANTSAPSMGMMQMANA